MRHIILLIFAVLLFQCKKIDYDDLAGTYVLKGVVVLTDTLTGITQQSIAKNYKVYIKYDTTSNGYLYTITADAQGKYAFSGIDTSRNYIIYASSDTSAVKYYGQKFYQKGAIPKGAAGYPATIHFAGKSKWYVHPLRR